jgi:hypothetical protein
MLQITVASSAGSVSTLWGFEVQLLLYYGAPCNRFPSPITPFPLRLYRSTILPTYPLTPHTPYPLPFTDIGSSANDSANVSIGIGVCALVLVPLHVIGLSMAILGCHLGRFGEPPLPPSTHKAVVFALLKSKYMFFDDCYHLFGEFYHVFGDLNMLVKRFSCF